MSRPKKYSQRFAKGCKLCGDPNLGRGIERHVTNAHQMDYDSYRKCFESSGQIVFDELRESGQTRSGKRVILHVLIRKFLV